MDIVIIAHFITEFVKDGTSRFVYLAEQLSQTHNVEIITSKFDHIAKKQRTTQEYDLKTKITLLDEPTYKKNVCLQRFVSHKSFGKQVKKYLASRQKPDVIYCAVPSLDCAYYAAQYAQKHNIKFIIDVQDLWPEAFKMVFKVPVVNDVLFYPMMKKADYIYSCADKIVGVSKTYCERAKKVNKKGAECIPVFLGTKLALFDKYVQENKIERNDDKFILGYCGTLGHSYDIKCVLDAMIHLRNNGHDNISLWVMGDGPLKNDFEKYALDNQLDVVFYGRVPYPKMCGLLASCDVCVNPITKGAAQSIINKHGDYAASGLPVISTQETSEYRELISSSGCGINCECSNSVQVAEAVMRLLMQDSEYVMMKSKSRQLAENYFNRAFSYQRIYQLFECLNKKEARTMSSLKEHQDVLLELLIEFDRVCCENDIKYTLFAGSALGAVRHQGFIPWDDDLDIALLREEYDKLMNLPDSKWNSEFYMQKEYSPHWLMHFSKLRKNNTTCLEKYHPKDAQTHQGIYIDIFPIDNASDNPFIRRLQFFSSKIVQAKSFWRRGYETTSIIKKVVMLFSCVLPTSLFHKVVTLRNKNDSKMVHSFFAGSTNYRKGVFERKWISETKNVPFNNIMVPVSTYYHDLLTMQYGDYMVLPPEDDRKCKVHAILVDTEHNYTEYEHYRDNMTFDVLTKSIR